ncbi:hypothetical protein [Vibrio sp. HN007]|uniref:hypothetical protein n=1 Tax=Vibrio iocasae TaxID=3098914 RepID=UPI0035D404C0
MKQAIISASILGAISFCSFADESQEIQDMSDPLAVYTQVGAGITDLGINLKIGQTFDTGVETTMGMNVFEIKGAMGDTLGFRERATDSIDYLRFRRFNVDLTNGLGGQLDVNYNFDNEAGSLSYSVIQALPALGALQLYPLAGLGAAFGNNVEGDNGEVISGYTVPGTFSVVGAYTKFTVTDKIWLNYNPMWMSTISGSDTYKAQGFSGHSSIFAHEVAASYQINPRFNVRYFSNWSEYTSFRDGEHRIEFNYQI